MNRENVLETLRAHESELKAAGVLSLRLFGSIPRGDARPDSGIDLMARFEKRLSPIDLAETECVLSSPRGAN